MSDARLLLVDVLGKLDAAAEADRPVPEPTGPVGHRSLCVGMSVYDDFDGAYFTMQSIRLHHPEVADRLSILIIDNHPEGLQSQALRDVVASTDNARYLPFSGFRGTAVRDLLFREADADYVCCVDSHVLFAPGALQALLSYFDEHPDTVDLIQGPLWSDDLNSRVGTHFLPEWGAGMYGRWGRDERVDDPSGQPFEIEMQGLGVFACRRDAWSGFNPRFRGFGGEEGYIHEKFRRAGGRVLCLPQFGWLHRFARPTGVPYKPTFDDRIRNYHIGWSEVGWDTEPIAEHFFEEYATNAGFNEVFDRAVAQSTSPFGYFDAIFSLNLDNAVERRAAAEHRYAQLDIAWRVERVSAVETPDNHHRGCALSWRGMIETAQRRGYQHFLGLEDDAVFLDATREVLAGAVAELDDLEWDVCFLGGVEQTAGPGPEPGQRFIKPAGYVTCTHATAIHSRVFDRILADIPEDGPEFDRWLEEHVAIDQYLGSRCASGELRGVILTPRVASQPALTTYADGDLELGDRYVI